MGERSFLTYMLCDWFYYNIVILTCRCYLNGHVDYRLWCIRPKRSQTCRLVTKCTPNGIVLLGYLWVCHRWRRTIRWTISINEISSVSCTTPHYWWITNRSPRRLPRTRVTSSADWRKYTKCATVRSIFSNCTKVLKYMCWFD